MSYQGESIVLPVGLRGFSGSKNPSKLGPDQLSASEALDLDGGILIKDGGALKLNAAALGAPSKVLAGVSWSPAMGNTEDVVFLGNGNIRKDTSSAGTFATSLAAGLAVSEEPPPFFCTAGGETVGSTRKLFLFSQAHQVRMLSGVAVVMNAIATPPADWASAFPTFGVQHANRLWAGGNSSDPHRIYWSESGNHENFTGATAGNLPIYPGEGDFLVGAVSFRGLLVVWKYPNGIYTIDTRDPVVANWRVDRVTRAVGGVNPNTIVPIENDVLYLDPGGNLHLLSATSDFGDVLTSNISELADLGAFVRSNVNLVSIRRSQGIWYGPKRKAWFIFPQAGTTVNTLKMTIDFADKKAGPRFMPSTRDIGTSMWMRPDTNLVLRPVMGDNLGFVRLMDRDLRSKDGVAYTTSFETADTDFAYAADALGGKIKQNIFLSITADLTEPIDLTVTPIWDGIATTPIVFQLGAVQTGLDSFILDTHSLAAFGIVTDRRRIPGSGRRLRIKVNHLGINEVRLVEFRVDLTMGDERIHK